MAVQLYTMMSSYLGERAGGRPILPRSSTTRGSTAATGAGASTPPASNGAATTTTLPAASSSPSAAPGSSASSSLLPAGAPTTPSAPNPDTVIPTAQSVFGANPWMAAPTGTGPTGTYSYNPYYFATPQTAATVASMVGGTVVSMESYSSGGRFVQNQPNEMVQLPNGALINPGLVAEFYTHGYSQSMISQMIANEVANVSEGD